MIALAREPNPKGSIARSRAEKFTFLSATKIYPSIPGRVTTKIAHLADGLFSWCLLTEQVESGGFDNKEQGRGARSSERDAVIS